MFRFLRSMFGRDDGIEAVPLLPEEDPVLSTPSARVVDIDGLLAQASTKVAVGRLRKLGKKMVSLLSRSKIDQLINQAIRRHVERTRTGDGSGAAPPPGDVNAEIRKEFDSLLSQHLGSALDGDGSPEGRAFEVVDGRLRPEVSLDRLQLEPGRGLHVETFNICSAGRVKGTGEVVFTSQRNAFLKVLADESTKKVLQQLELGFVAHGDSGYIVGDPAIELGRIFGKIPRRPMQKGMLSPDEPVALFILSLLLRQLVGVPGKPGEICVYSVPADPIEGDHNFIYHLGALESALKTLGYTPRPMMESHLLVSSELKDQDYTGIGVTCGAGMFNVGIAYKGLPVLSFSTFQGGDWIDRSVSDALGLTLDEANRVREGGMDLQEPKGRIEGAVAIYTRTLLHKTVEALKQKVAEAQSLPSFGRPIPIVCAGKVAMSPGFLELFKEEIEQARLPIRIDYIRLAQDPLTAVAQGCLQAALEESRAQNEVSTETAPAVLERAAVSGVPTRGLPSLSAFRQSRAG